MRNILLAFAAATVAVASPVLAKKAPPPPPPAPAQSLTCKDGTISTGKARQQACRGHGGIFAAVATKTVATAPGSVSATTLATKLPNAAPTKTVATTVNNGPSTARTEVTQISTPGAPDTHMKTVPGDITVRCHDGKVMKVRTIRKACRGHGGLVSSVTTAVMVVPAGESKSIATKTGTGIAVATTKNPENAASATRVTQTTVYASPVTAICRDGSTTSTTSRKDACTAHGGVKLWK